MASKYKRKNITGDKLAFDRAKAELKRRESLDKSRTIVESEAQITRHEELTGINREMWDELLKEKVKSAKLQAAIDASYR